MKKLISVLCCLVLGFGACSALVACGPNTPAKAGDYKNCLITMDINPSVEIITGVDGLVKSVSGLNNDAKMMLVDLKLSGKTVDEVMAILLAESKKVGYIFDGGTDNAVLVSVAAEDKTGEEKVEVALRESVQTFVNDSNTNINFLTAGETADPTIIANAEKLGVTVAKYKVIVLAQKYNAALTLEAGKLLSMGELNEIIFKAREKRAEILSDEIEKEYDLMEDKNEMELDIKVVELTSQKIETASDEILKKVIGDNAKADIVALYKAYYEELKNVNTPSEGSTYTLDAETKTALEAKIREFNKINEEMKAIKSEMKALDKASATYEEDRKVLKDKFKTSAKTKDTLEDELEEMTEVIEEKLEEAIETGTYSAIDLTLAEDCKWDFDIDASDLVDAKFEAIEEKYEELFSEKKIDIEELEDLFEDEIDAAMKDMETAADQKMNQFLQTKKAELDALREALIAEKKALVELNK